MSEDGSCGVVTRRHLKSPHFVEMTTLVAQVIRPILRVYRD